MLVALSNVDLLQKTYEEIHLPSTRALQGEELDGHLSGIALVASKRVQERLGISESGLGILLEMIV